jgi:hypothetical protein
LEKRVRDTRKAAGLSVGAGAALNKKPLIRADNIALLQRRIIHGLLGGDPVSFGTLGGTRLMHSMAGALDIGSAQRTRVTICIRLITRIKTDMLQ